MGLFAENVTSYAIESNMIVGVDKHPTIETKSKRAGVDVALSSMANKKLKDNYAIGVYGAGFVYKGFDCGG